MTTADNQPLGQALAENQAFLQTMFGGSSDFYTKSFTICGCRCCIAMFAGLSSPEKLCIMVLHALGQGVPGCKAGPQLVQYLAEQSCLPTEQTPITTRTQLVEALAGGMAVLLVDTVGFVSRLPHNLVEAFKSTLEEAAWSDVIIRVADAGDEQREEQLSVTDEVLDGLDCADIPRLTVYNKCDKPGAMSFDPDILLTSAKTGYGLDKLLQKLDEVLSDRVHTIRVLLPYDKLGLAAPMRERGSVQVEEYREDGLYLEGIVKTEDLHCFEGYLV